MVRDIQADALVAGRSRERFEQYTRSGRIVGGDVTRLGAPDSTVSLFGTLHTDLALNLTPALSRGRG